MQLHVGSSSEINLVCDSARNLVVTAANEHTTILFGSAQVVNKDENDLVVLADHVGGVVRTAPIDDIPEEFYKI